MITIYNLKDNRKATISSELRRTNLKMLRTRNGEHFLFLGGGGGVGGGGGGGGWGGGGWKTDCANRFGM